jgi:acyl-coenzyme A thioesterase PaaI-like protein
VSSERLVHHELCFGCGRANLFGLLMDLEPTEEGRVQGRGFVKQDHQGRVPGTAHEGILAAALSEAMSFAAGQAEQAFGIEIDIQAPVPVGVFLDVEARARATPGGDIEARASASVDGRPVATARGLYGRRA